MTNRPLGKVADAMKVEGLRVTHVIVDDPMLRVVEYHWLYGDGGPEPVGLLPEVRIELDLTKDVEAMMRGMMREFVVKLIDDNREMLVRENPVQKIKRNKRGNKHTPKWSRWS